MKPAVIPDERIVNRIYMIRGKKVMLDRDLAELYGVETKDLNQAVHRNLKRFPEEFMFQFTEQELANWRSQFVMSNPALQMGLRRRPYAFTEHGVAMLSSVLRSDRAIQINILIIKAFIRMREMLAGYKELREKIEAMERKYDQRFKVVFEALKRLVAEEEKPKRQMGFGHNEAQ